MKPSTFVFIHQLDTEPNDTNMHRSSTIKIEHSKRGKKDK